MRRSKFFQVATGAGGSLGTAKKCQNGCEPCEGQQFAIRKYIYVRGGAAGGGGWEVFITSSLLCFAASAMMSGNAHMNGKWGEEAGGGNRVGAGAQAATPARCTTSIVCTPKQHPPPPLPLPLPAPSRPVWLLSGSHLKPGEFATGAGAQLGECGGHCRKLVARSMRHEA